MKTVPIKKNGKKEHKEKKQKKTKTTKETMKTKTKTNNNNDDKKTQQEYKHKRKKKENQDKHSVPDHGRYQDLLRDFQEQLPELFQGGFDGFSGGLRSSSLMYLLFQRAPFEEKHSVPGQGQGASSHSGATVSSKHLSGLYKDGS